MAAQVNLASVRQVVAQRLANLVAAVDSAK